MTFADYRDRRAVDRTSWQGSLHSLVKDDVETAETQDTSSGLL